MSADGQYHSEVDTADLLYRGVRAYLEGSTVGGFSGAVLTNVLDEHRGDYLTRIRAYMDGVRAPSQIDEADIDTWTLSERTQANIRALGVLRALADEKRTATATERMTLLAYSGWGGIDPLDVPEAVLSDVQRGYLKALHAWNLRKMQGKQEPPPIDDAFRGIVTQYFTPFHAARGMWGLARRMGFAGGRALEPSAGAGRFLHSAPSDLSVAWTAVEMDASLAAVLVQTNPGVDLRFGTFETFLATQAQTPERFDLVIGNPPYALHAPYRGIDPTDKGEYKREHDYFVDRTAKLLSPGGKLLLLVPTGCAVGAGADQRYLRTELARRCHIDAVVFLPVDLFSGAWLNTCVICLTRRGHDLTVPREEDLDFVEGNWLNANVQPTNVLGKWISTNYRGLKLEGEEQGVVLRWTNEMGPFDPSRIANAALRSMPPEEALAIRDAQTRQAVVHVPHAHVETAPDDLIPTHIVRATALAVRVETFLQTRGEDAERAEAGREELCRDVFAWITAYGNPHTGDARRYAKRARITAFLAAVGQDGVINPVLAQGNRTSQVGAYPGTGTDPADVVRWFSRKKGYCLYEDLSAHYVHPDAHDKLLATDDIAVEYIADRDPEFGITGWVYYAWPDYLMGQLWPRVDRVRERQLQADIPPLERPKIDRQYEALIAVIRPMNLIMAPKVAKEQEGASRESGEIELSIRSGFIPVSVLAAYLNERDEKAKQKYHVLGPDGLVTYTTNDAGVSIPVQKANTVILALEDGLLLITGGGPFSANVVSYWNREDTVEAADSYDRDRGARKRRHHEERRGKDGKLKTMSVTDVQKRMSLDAEIEQDFVAWLANTEDQLQATLDAYNRTFLGNIPRVYSEEPIAIARLAHVKGYTLKRHQNSAVRRLVDHRGGIAALDTGIGKTAVGIATLALLRQQGEASRALIGCPNSIMVNWYREIHAWLPDYRIGMIGLTIQPDGSVTPDDQKTREEKWKAFGLGAYDVGLVGYSQFLDVDVRPTERARILREEAWLTRAVAIDDRERKGERILRKDVETEVADLQDSIATRKAYVQDNGYAFAPARTAITEAHEKEELLEKAKKKLFALGGDTLPPEQRAALREVIAELVQARKAEESAEDRLKKLKHIQEKGGKKKGKKGESVSASDIMEAEAAILTAANDVMLTQKVVEDAAHGFGLAIDADLIVNMSTAPVVRDLEVAEQEAQKWIESRELKRNPPLAWWEDLGVDLLIIDEAHNFKNLWYPETRYGETTKFLGSGSKLTRRAWDLFAKAKYLREQHGDAGVVLLTATPLKNSPLELYNMLCYVSTRVWTDRGVVNKEQFIDRYIHIESGDTLDPRSGMKTVPIAWSFKNLDELFAIGSIYIEVKNAYDIIERAKAEGRVPDLVVPEAEREHVQVQMTTEQRAAYATLRARAKAVAEGTKESGDPGRLIIGGYEAGEAEDEEDEAGPKKRGRKPAEADPLDIGEAVTRDQALSNLLACSNPKAEMLCLIDRMTKAATDLYLLEPGVWYSDIPTKYVELAARIRRNLGCGHIIFCFAGDTEIVTDGGVRAIGPLAGTVQRVLTRNHAWVDAPIRSFGVQEIYELIVTKGRRTKTIRTTAPHRWFVRKSAAEAFHEVVTSELLPGKHRLQQVHAKSYKNWVDPSPFGVAHGFTLGDGTTPPGARHSAHADAHGAKIAIEPYFAMCPRKELDGVDATRFSALPNFFKTLPSIHETSAYLLGWLMGYFAADGTVTAQGQVRITSVVRENISFVRDACVLLGIATSVIGEDVSTSGFVIGTRSFRLNLQPQTLDASFFLLPHHRAAFLAAEAEDKASRDWIVQSVRATGQQEEVFCATVEDEHAFVLEGDILTGNCDFNGVHDRLRSYLGDVLFNGDVSRIATVSGDNTTIAQRQEVADRFNGVPASGDTPAIPAVIDILIAQSKVVGEGMNLQTRTCAMHHLTLPWEPATIRQRDGRGVRQGNEWALETGNAVLIYYYLSLKSFDIYRWEMINAKFKQQSSLFAEGVREALNPMAGMDFDIDTLLILFEDDEDKAREMLAVKKEERRVAKVARDQGLAMQDFGRAAGNFERARMWAQDKDATRRKQGVIARETAQRIVARLLEMPMEIVPPGMRRMLAEVPTSAVYYNPENGLELVAGRAACVATMKKYEYKKGESHVPAAAGPPTVRRIQSITWNGAGAETREQGHIADETLYLGNRPNYVGRDVPGASEAHRDLFRECTDTWDAAQDAADIVRKYGRAAPITTREWNTGLRAYETITLPGRYRHGLSIKPSHLQGAAADVLEAHGPILWENVIDTLVTEMTPKYFISGKWEMGDLAREKALHGVFVPFLDGESIIAVPLATIVAAPETHRWRRDVPLLPLRADREIMEEAISHMLILNVDGTRVSKSRGHDTVKWLGTNAWGLTYQIDRFWHAAEVASIEAAEAANPTDVPRVPKSRGYVAPKLRGPMAPQNTVRAPREP